MQILLKILSVCLVICYITVTAILLVMLFENSDDNSIVKNIFPISNNQHSNAIENPGNQITQIEPTENINRIRTDTVFYDNGRIKSEVSMLAHQKHGEEKIYINNKNNVLREVNFYQYDTLEKQDSYYDGRLKRTSIFNKDGVIIDVINH